jgi:non-ribosomal peptide synthetase component F
MLGVFTNLVPLEIRGATRGALRARTRTQQLQLASDLDHREVSGIEVQRMIAQRAGDPRPGLFPVVFTSMLGEEQVRLSDDLVEIVHSITQTPQTWLDCKVYERDGRICVDWDAPTALFPAGLLDSMFAAYIELLQKLADSSSAWEETDRSLIPASERSLMAQVNDTRGPLPDDMLHEPVFAAAAANPEAVAVIAESGTMTFNTLVDSAVALSHQLNALLLPSDRLIAIVMDKCSAQIVAALAILETGRAFLPISTDQPDARIWKILQQAGVRVVLVEESRILDRGVEDFACLRVSKFFPSAVLDTRLPQTAKPDDVAYVIYTSGSTGTPKGVTIAHRAARNTLADLVERFKITSADRVLWVSSLAFDLSIFDLFGVLGAGGCVVVPPTRGHQNPIGWAEAVHQYGVTIWNSVPALADLVLTAAGKQASTLLASLRAIMMSGDWIPLSLPDRLRAALPQADLFSLGGATEASIWSILYPSARWTPHGPASPTARRCGIRDSTY